MILAAKCSRNRFIDMRGCGSHKKPCTCKKENVSLAFGKQGKFRFFKLHCRNHGMVIRYLFAVKKPCNLWCKFYAFHKRKLWKKHENNLIRCFFHIVCQVVAVRSRIGQKLLFIKALCKVKGLLCGVTENAVCFLLKCGKIKELRRQHFLFFRGNRSADCRFSFAGCCDFFCRFFLWKLFAYSFRTV